MKMRVSMLAIGLACRIALAAAADAVPVPPGGDLVSIPTRPGVTQGFLLLEPSGAVSVASLILFTGGEGDLELAEQPADWVGENFLVRSRALFAAAGFTIAVVDTPSDHVEGYDGFRTSAAHATDIAAVIAYLRARHPVPVWLVGTSRGTISAANGALLRNGGADGLVLTSTVTRGSKRRPQSVMDLALADIRLPTLIVHNRDDACSVTPYSGVADLQHALKHAATVAVQTFAGGDPPQSEPCEALSRHGYLGLEPAVVTAITAWIKSPAARP
jgi:pimeloyl-ACP methyl ester carboxylesterase